MRSRSMSRSQCWTTVSKSTGSLSAPDINSTGSIQPWKKPAVGSRPKSILTFQDLRFNQYTIWLAVQKAMTLSRGHHRGLRVIQCGRWLTPIFSILFTIRVDKHHQYCMREWACRWCRIVKRYKSLHRLLLIINFWKLYKWVETRTTNQR